MWRVSPRAPRLQPRLTGCPHATQVCRGKTLADAKQPPSPAHPNDGIGDGILIINGSSVSYNCDLPGYSVPVSLVIDGPQSYFQIQGRGGVLPATTRDALGTCLAQRCCGVRWCHD